MALKKDSPSAVRAGLDMFLKVDGIEKGQPKCCPYRSHSFGVWGGRPSPATSSYLETWNPDSMYVDCFEYIGQFSYSCVQFGSCDHNRTGANKSFLVPDS